MSGSVSDSSAIEIDMTPMMNMLIILISFLVTMVVFSQLAIIKFNLPPTSGEQNEGNTTVDSLSKTGPEFTILVSENGFQIIGENQKYDPIPKNLNGYDFKKLDFSMNNLKKEFPTSSNVVLLIDANILYQDVIGAMDILRENNFPNILLSGGVTN